MKKCTTFLVLAPVLFGGCSESAPAVESAADVNAKRGAPVRVSQFGEFADWDKNGDGQLTREEFEWRLSDNSVFYDFDGDGDGEITELEFQTGLYNAWDTNGDQTVDTYEYRYGSAAWFADEAFYGVFEDWDKDGDKELTMVEFREPLRRKTIEGWDNDESGKLNEVEFGGGIWAAWDMNGDGTVDLYEYKGES